MKILVTGGAGFIGSAVVRQAIRDGHEVVNLDALTYAANLANVASVSNAPGYAFEQVDIRDRAALDRVFARHRPDAVMHLAAESHVDRSIDGPGAFIDTNITGTFNLLEAARAYWTREGTPPDFRFHHISTDEVFGSLGESGQFTETSPYDPRSPYSASKAASDHLVRAWHETYGLPVVMTNCSNNYGPFHFPEKLIPLCLTNILDGKPLPIYGDGKQIRDWLFVEDHCRGIELVLDKGVVGETYNIGGVNEWQNIDIVQLLCELVDGEFAADAALAARFPDAPQARGEGAASLITYVTDRAGHDRRYAVGTDKIRAELGYVPQETFQTGIAKTIKWYLSNEAWWRPLQKA